jgi:hypothetical protein
MSFSIFLMAEKIKRDEEEIMEDNSEEETKKDNSEEGLLDKIRENPFIAATIVLGIVVIALLVNSFIGTGSVITGGVVSIDNASASIENFLEVQTGGQGTLKQIEDYNDYLYLTIINYQGQEIPLYITKDGLYLIQGLTELNFETNVPKSDKPTADLYIWSYCLYGVTALEPFAQVASLLGNYADFKVYLYYAEHGDFEIQQNKIQACIQNLGYNSYWKYAEAFATEVYDKCYGDATCDLEESTNIMKSLGIDSNKVLSCVESEGESLLEEHYNVAREIGVTGSPSLIVNGIKVNPSRTAEAYKEAICSAFNNSPEECSQTLDSTGSTASGSC